MEITYRLISKSIDPLNDRLTGITKITHGDDHICILSSSGVTVVKSPAATSNINLEPPLYNQPIDDIASGGQHIVAKSGNTLITWGSNTDGQGVPTGQIDVSNDYKQKIASFCTGTYYTSCTYEDGTVNVWGDNSDKQITNKPTEYISKVFSGGEGNIFGLTRDKILFSWGEKEQNYVFTNIKLFYPGAYHHVAITYDDEIIGFGKTKTNELELPKDAKNIAMIAIGGELPGHTFILYKSGELIAFGNNNVGQLNYNGPYTTTYSGVVPGEWKYISTGMTWSVGVTSDNQLKGWGLFNSDQ